MNRHHQRLVVILGILGLPGAAAADPLVVQGSSASPQGRALEQTASAASGIKAIAADVNRLVLGFDLSSAYLTAPHTQMLEGVLVAPPQSRSELTLHLMPGPSYWFSLGVANALRRSSSYTVSSKGGPVATETVRLSDDVAFTFVVNKRIGDLVLMAGMIDSRSGVGVEVRRWSDSLRLNAVVYDPNGATSGSVRSRISGSLQWHSVYVLAGVQDPNNRLLRSYMTGVGLRWTDEDLKRAFFWITRL